MKFVLTRFGYAVIVIFLASIGTFIGLHGSPGSVISSVFDVATTPHSVIVAYERRHGLLDPVWVQYWHYISGIVTGRFGTSLVNDLPVMTIFTNSIGYTAQLAGAAFALAFGLGIPIGVLAAIKRDSVSTGSFVPWRASSCRCRTSCSAPCWSSSWACTCAGCRSAAPGPSPT